MWEPALGREMRGGFPVETSEAGEGSGNPRAKGYSRSRDDVHKV